MAQTTIYTYFARKACHARELMDIDRAEPTTVEIVKVIELTQRQFRYFYSHLLEDMPFIIANKSLTGYDKGVTRCLLVTARKNQDAVLVDCQGYNFPRYTAYVRRKADLDLSGIPVTRYRPKQWEPYSGQDR